MLRLGVTGTDTGVGKTAIARALIALVRERGVSTGAIKPIETGVSRGDPESDHVLLAEAAGVEADWRVCPWVLEAPLAPWLAAQRAGQEIDLAVLHAAFIAASEGKRCIVAEGAGGLLTPISRSLRFDGLFAHWDLDLIIVGANRLGVINHTLLTVEAARRADILVRVVVLNGVHAAHDESQERNAAALRALVPEVPVVEIPHIAPASGSRLTSGSAPRLDIEALKEAVRTAGLLQMLGATE